MLLTFLLGPIWPALSLICILLFVRQRKYLKFACFNLFLGTIPIILLVLNYSSLLGYLKIYLYTNFVYTVPSYHNSYYHESWALTIIKAIFSPILALINPGVSPILLVTKTLSLLFLISLGYLVIKKKYLQAGIYFLMLGLTNIRFVEPGSGHYTGFHLLPWYGTLIFVATALYIKKLKIAYVILIALALSASISFAKSELFVKKDFSKDYLINYSTHTDIGQIIKIFTKPQDTLFVSPDAWLVYWQSNTNHLPKLFGYYAWMQIMPQIHNKVIQTFKTNPPTFLYCDDCQNAELGQYLNKYKEIKRYGGKTNLYVLPERLQNLTQTQIDQLRFYGLTLL